MASFYPQLISSRATILVSFPPTQAHSAPPEDGWLPVQWYREALALWARCDTRGTLLCLNRAVQAHAATQLAGDKVR